jgi:hypothetical protein
MSIRTMDYQLDNFEDVKKMIKIVGMPDIFIIYCRNPGQTFKPVYIYNTVSVKFLKREITEHIGSYNGEFSSNYFFQFIKK